MTEETILIVEGSPDIRLGLKSILQRRGYRLLVAENGEKGIRLARTEGVELILLNTALSKMDGFAVCEVLKNDPVTGEIPILFLSAGTEVKNKVRGLRLGGEDYIDWPLDRGEVLARVQTQLRVRRLNRELAESNAALLEMQVRMEENLRAAREMQRSLLPRHCPVSCPVQAAWRFQPGQRVGGDLFTIFPLTGDAFGFYMLDVSGHGVAAALVAMSVARALDPASDSGIVVRGRDREEIVPPAEVLAILDKQFPMERFDTFFTVFYGVFDLKSRTLSYSSAGHPPSFLLRQGGEVDFLDKGGAIIGLGGALPFEGGMLSVRPGDRVVLYTDGLVEYEREDEEMFGQDRLLELLVAHKDMEPEQFASSVIRDVQSYGNGITPADDQSLLVLEFTGAEMA